ncbi:MAG: DUF4388 domain-containing protein, partial [Planctomycetota bacterium]
MTIKGTLETFNLRELLQMLAFNQKVGTLVLETEAGTRTVYVDQGRVAFVEGDAGASEAFLRVVRRRGMAPPDRIERALKIRVASDEFLGDILVSLGALDVEQVRQASEEALGERFLTLQLTSITRFEFADGQVLAPDGTEKWPDGRPRRPLEPGLVVEGLLLDLTRKMDQWAELTHVVPLTAEVYEGTGISVDVAEALHDEEVDAALADPVVRAIDGYRTLDQVVEASDVDALTVVQIVAALVQGGGVGPVATEDLLTRGKGCLGSGEAARALPLLRRAVERGDAPSTARLLLADALEAMGRRAAAAAELDTFAMRAQDEKPIAVFDALHRALQLRDGEMASAARLADYYIQNRPWLHDRRAEAVEALRTLIHGAVAARQPQEAAARLAEFVQNGDAPSEDLLVLADLHASAGDRPAPATALFRRAEGLLAHRRVGPARDLLRRTVQLDPSRADARGRLLLLEGEQRRRRQKKRIFVLLIALGLTVFGAGAAWWTYNQQAARAVRSVREQAENAVSETERLVKARRERFEARLEAARTAVEPDPELSAALDAFLNEEKRLLDKADRDVLDFAQELERYAATDSKQMNEAVLANLHARVNEMRTGIEGLAKAARDEGGTALKAGEKAHAAGNFVKAQAFLRIARNLSFDDTARAARAALLLRYVDAYIADFKAAKAPFAAARTAGDVEQTFRLGTAILAKQLDSDLTRALRLPVQLASNPPGAHVRLGGEETGLVTPCTVEYSPFATTSLQLWLPGRVPQVFHLPSFDDVIDDPKSVTAWTPSIAAACWCATSSCPASSTRPKRSFAGWPRRSRPTRSSTSWGSTGRPTRSAAGAGTGSGGTRRLTGGRAPRGSRRRRRGRVSPGSTASRHPDPPHL